MKSMIRAALAAAVIFLLPLKAGAEQLLIPVGRVVGLQLKSGSVTVAAFDDARGMGARKAGLRIGDEITMINGKTIACIEDVQQALKQSGEEKCIIRDKLNPGDFAVLVVPIDKAAPKGRLILPQQQTIRELLDHHMMAMVCQDTEVAKTLEMLSVKPKLVITDSQAFGRVAQDVPEDIPLTSFSILFARYKGSLPMLLRGAAALDRLRDGDRVLIAEGCTHHRQCNDIGTVKMPRWIGAHTGKRLDYAFSSGGEFPQDLGEYALVVHCGGCTLTEQMMSARLGKAKAAGVPVINYGMAIAHMHGILKRSLEVFPDAARLMAE